MKDKVIKLKKSDQIRGILREMEKRGKLTPDAVIAQAKNPKSPLHGKFQWNIQKAAMEHWRETARDLIASYRIEIVIDEQVFKISEFVRDVRKSSDAQGYRSVGQLKSKRAEAAIFIERELLVAATYCAKAISYAAYLGLTGKIEALIAEINELARKASLAKAA